MSKSNLTVCLLVILLACSGTAYAGGAGGFGLKGGLAISTLGTDDESFKDARARFRLGGTGGFSYEIASEGSVAFDMELLYDLRGSKQKFESGGADVVVKDFLHYLNVPLSLKFYIGDVFNIHFGGYFGVAVAGVRKIDGDLTLGGVMFEGESKTDLFGDGIKNIDPEKDDYLSRFDGGLHVGVEFVSESGFGVGGRGYIGLADITNDDHILGNRKASTAEISIYAIIRFGAN